MNEPRKHDAKWKKPGTKDRIWNIHSYEISRINSETEKYIGGARGLRGEENRELTV